MDCDDQQQSGAAHPLIAGQLAGVKVDLSHVQELLRDAVDNLLAEAFAIREACRNVPQEKADEATGAPQAASVLRDIDQHAGSLLRHLQFQDMVSQLLDHVRIGIDAAETLALQGSQPASPPSGLPEGKSKPVQSRDMSAGDIDLF